MVLGTYNFGEHVAQTSNDEVDEQKKNRHQLQKLVCKAKSMGSIFFFEVSFKAKLFQEARFYGFHQQIYLPAVNRQGCYNHDLQFCHVIFFWQVKH